MEELKKQLADARQKASELEMHNTELDGAKQSLAKVTEVKNRKLQEKQEELQAVTEQDQKVLEAVKEQHQKVLEEEASARAQDKVKIEQLEKNTKDLVSEKAVRAAAVGKEHAATQKRLEELENKLQQSETECEKLQHYHRELQDANPCQQIATLQQQNAALRYTEHSIEDDTQNKNSEIQQLLANLRVSQQQENAAKELSDKRQHELEDVKRQLEEKGQDEIHKLQAQLRDMDNERKADAERGAKEVQQLKELSNKRQHELQEENLHLKELERSAGDERDKLKEHTEVLEVKHSSEQSDAQKAKAECDELKTQLRDLDRQLQETQFFSAQWKMRVDKDEKTRKAKEETIETLQEKIQSLEQECSGAKDVHDTVKRLLVTGGLVFNVPSSVEAKRVLTTFSPSHCGASPVQQLTDTFCDNHAASHF